MEPKLMSYITAKYSSKSDMMLSKREWQEVMGNQYNLWHYVMIP